MSPHGDRPGTGSRGPLEGGEAADVLAGRLRRVRVFLDRSELPWLPVSEAAFLLWVLAMLVAVWVVVGMMVWVGSLGAFAAG